MGIQNRLKSISRAAPGLLIQPDRNQLEIRIYFRPDNFFFFNTFEVKLTNGKNIFFIHMRKMFRIFLARSDMHARSDVKN